MKKRKFAEGGTTGRFDDDIYARARKFVEDNERRAGEGMALEEEEEPKPKRAKPAVDRNENYGNEGYRKSAPKTDRAEIPGGRSDYPDVPAPKGMGESPSELERNLGALGPAGAAGLGLAGLARVGRGAMNAYRAKKAAEVAQAGEKAREGLAAATRAGIAADRAQPARSTAGRVADIQEALKTVPRRAAEAKNKRAADEMSKARRRARTKDDSEAGIEFSKGGSVSASRRADGIAQRGKTKGRMY